MDSVEQPRLTGHDWISRINRPMPMPGEEMLAPADRPGLTLDEAGYREHARRRTLPLPTLDDNLLAAAEALGVTLLGGWVMVER
jgi:hypothetical protein